ncbi:MAG: hypothetical protein EXR27_00850 [Betaproteobacteria bacterium]|nr:hypothetical protein [Betaproteobacteria bacterium]
MRVLRRHNPGQGWVVETESGKASAGARAVSKTRDEAVDASREHWPDHELEVVNENIVPGTDASHRT